MKKIRLLLTALASMLAIGSYAQAEDDWAENAKQELIKVPGYTELGDYFNMSPTFVYLQEFGFAAEDRVIRPIRETEKTVKLEDRSMGLQIGLYCAFLLNPDKKILEEDRPELNWGMYTAVKNDCPLIPVLKRLDIESHVAQSWGTMQFSNSTKESPQAFMDAYAIDKGGDYTVIAMKDAKKEVVDHQMHLTVKSDAECLVDVGFKHKGFVLGDEGTVQAIIASGYPYVDRLSDYQNKKMTFSIYDAEGKTVLSPQDINLNADPDKTLQEYVVESERYSFKLTSTKYTFKISGPLLKEDLVITKEVEPDFSELNAAIEEAEALCDEIMNDPVKASLYANKVEALKKRIENAKECLKLKVDKQEEINTAATALRFLTADVRIAAQREISDVSNAEDLRTAIQNDPFFSPTIQLTSDIDLSGVEGTLFNSFGGIINGSKPDGSTYALFGAKNYLFEKVSNAKFSNLTFKNAVVQNKDNNLGVISRSAINCIFENIHMESISVECQGTNAGSITGYAENCEFNHIYISAAENSGLPVAGIVNASSKVIANASCAGGIVGSSLKCSFNDCHNDSKVSIFASTGSSGGFTGKSNQDSFQECENQAFVGANQKNLGGIAGESKDSKFLQCKNAGTILPGAKDEFNKCLLGITFTPGSFNTTGGICGAAENGSLEQCSNYSNTKIYGKAGGLLGSGTKVSINNCLNAPEDWQDKALSSTTCAGFINVDNNCKITNSLNAIDSRLIASSTNTNSKSAYNYSLHKDNSTRQAASYEMFVTEDQIKKGIVARWLNNGYENRKEGFEPWRQNVAQSASDWDFDPHPVLDPSRRIITTQYLCEKLGTGIGTMEDLLKFAIQVNDEGDQFACAYLIRDIDFTGQPYQWTPIGKDAPGKHFRGIFDGCGHTIKGLKIASKEAVGLFGAVHANAEICNVIVEDGEFSNVVDGNTGTGGDKGAGGIVGKVYIGWTWGTVIIENCGSSANVNAVQHAGGILGFVDTNNTNNVKVFINNCWSMGTVTAQKGNDNNGNSGLLCGYMRNHGVVSDCWSGGQLKTAPGFDCPPYSYVNSSNNKEGEFLVGYSQTLEIKDCSILNPAYRVARYNEHELQAGVSIISDEDLSSGEFCYKLNNGVVDGTQTWYQAIGTDACPVRNKLKDGTNIVFGIFDPEGNITRYGNTSREEITKVILGIWDFEAHRVTDVNKSGDVDVTDVTTFTKAATMK